jgi:hypothetical protein
MMTTEVCALRPRIIIQGERWQAFSQIFTGYLLTFSAQMAQWDLAAVLLALMALALTDTGWKVISSIALHLGRCVWPDHARCDQLSWNDIPDGQLHDPYIRDHAHNRTQRLWGTTIGNVFNRARVSHFRHPILVKKPEQLDFRKRFLRTDIDTILAFIMLTVGKEKRSDWDTSRLHFGDTRVSFEECQGVLVVHPRGTIRSDCVSLTKREVQLMLQGYPPFYREIVTLAHGPYVPHPIRNEQDIERGGWIIAVGFHDKCHPLALYTLPNQAEDLGNSYFERSNGGPFRNAIKRVLDVLKDVMLPIFPDDSVRNVIRAVNYMVVHRTGSGVPDSDVPVDSFDQLTGQQCSIAMKIFNDLRPLKAEEEKRLRPVLLPVLRAAFLGSFIVTQYLKDIGVQLILPKLLEDHRYRPIYLRDFEDDR